MKKIIICTLLLIAALTTAASAEKYAVLIAGIGATWKDGDPLPPNNPLAVSGKDNTVPYERALWCDTYLMWEQLRLKGYKDENIFVLYGDGNDCSLDFLNERYISNLHPNSLLNQPKITDYPATKSKVQEVFTMLQTKSTTDDFVFVWTFSHGGYDYNWEPHILLMPEDLSNNYVEGTARWFSRLTKNIPAHKILYQMQQCYSGSWISYLEANNSIVMTASNVMQSAHTADDRTKNIWSYEENEKLEPFNSSSRPPLFREHYHAEFNFHIRNA